MKLTERQKKHLRGLAHSLKPVISLGDKGVTDSFLQELNSTLEHHELIKVKVKTGDRDSRDTIIDELTQQLSAALISRVGNVATLYRPRKRKPGIVLPA
ncbi:MAG: ribosome assembly RNA-binding protein YhbY [Gammaproteobacteria bacterium]|nr:ribosome assembly RNA-binding protein YhbY [Gammaproteobacteria bacterium]NND53517.1 ribosome assembly RNA-binding protein YhbY [Gammaproteobacteria bacterium]